MPLFIFSANLNRFEMTLNRGEMKKQGKDLSVSKKVCTFAAQNLRSAVEQMTL